MAELEKLPFIIYHRSYTKEELHNAKKQTWKIRGSKADRVLHVYKQDGDQPLEFHLDEVDRRFDEVAKESSWNGQEKFDNYRTVLTDTALSAWDARVKDSYTCLMHQSVRSQTWRTFGASWVPSPSSMWRPPARRRAPW